MPGRSAGEADRRVSVVVIVALPSAAGEQDDQRRHSACGGEKIIESLEYD